MFYKLTKCLQFSQCTKSLTFIHNKNIYIFRDIQGFVILNQKHAVRACERFTLGVKYLIRTALISSTFILFIVHSCSIFIYLLKHALCIPICYHVIPYIHCGVTETMENMLDTWHIFFTFFHTQLGVSELDNHQKYGMYNKYDSYSAFL